MLCTGRYRSCKYKDKEDWRVLSKPDGPVVKVKMTEVVLILLCQQGVEEKECSPAEWEIFFSPGEDAWSKQHHQSVPFYFIMRFSSQIKINEPWKWDFRFSDWDLNQLAENWDLESLPRIYRSPLSYDVIQNKVIIINVDSYLQRVILLYSFPSANDQDLLTVVLVPRPL